MNFGFRERFQALDRMPDDLVSSDFRIFALRADLAAMKKSPVPRLSFIHTLLPHWPWMLGPGDSIYAYNLTDASWDDPYVVRLWQQRYLLQLMRTDQVLGEYLDHIEAIGDFDRAIIVVTADHGLHFSPEFKRPINPVTRPITGTAMGGSAGVPLFYKEPAQKAGTIQRQPVQLTDIAPTIAAALGIESPWAFDGRDMFAPGTRPSRSVTSIFHGTLDVPDDFEAMIATIAAEMHEMFGDGNSSGLYALGGARDLIGTQAARWATGPSAHCWNIEHPVIVPDSDGVGVFGDVFGHIGSDVSPPIAVALSVDGVVTGTAESFMDGPTHRVYVIGTPQFLRSGEPVVELHEIVDGRLASMPLC